MFCNLTISFLSCLENIPNSMQFTIYIFIIIFYKKIVLNPSVHNITAVVMLIILMLEESLNQPLIFAAEKS